MDFSFLKNKDISIIGHDNPDVDSIISGILLEKLFAFLGINAKFIILDELVDDAIISVLSKFNIKVSNYIISDLTENVVLVDHHKTKHNFNILGIIDHHPTLQNIDCDLFLNKLSPSTTLHIYNLMIKYKYPITKEIVELVIIGVYTDTCSLKSSKVSENDKQLIYSIIKQYNLNEEFFYNEGLLLRDLKTMKFELILNNAAKYYQFENVVLKSSYLRIGKLSDIDFVLYDLIHAARQEIINTNMESWVFIFVALKEEKTLEIVVSKNNLHQQVYNSILSRGKDIIPKIEFNILNNRKKVTIV